MKTTDRLEADAPAVRLTETVSQSNRQLMEKAIKMMNDKQKHHLTSDSVSGRHRGVGPRRSQTQPATFYIWRSVTEPPQWDTMTPLVWCWKKSCTCTGGGRLTHAGGVAVGVGNLLRQLLLGASVCLVVLLLVLHQDFSHQLHRAGQRHTGLQLTGVWTETGGRLINNNGKKGTLCCKSFLPHKCSNKWHWLTEGDKSTNYWKKSSFLWVIKM